MTLKEDTKEAQNEPKKARGRRKRYNDEYKQEAVNRVTESRDSVAQVAHEFGVPYGTLSRWVQDHKTRDKNDGPSSFAEVAEIKRLKKDLRQALLENDILKKSVQIFAQKKV